MFRCRGVFHVGTLRSLLLIFTLLSVFCSASSWIDKYKLREFKENIELLKQEAARREVSNMLDIIFFQWVFEKMPHLMDDMTKMVRNGIPDFPELPESLQAAKDVIIACKGFVDNGFKKLAEKIKDYEKKVEQLEVIIINLEQRKYEL